MARGPWARCKGPRWAYELCERETEMRKRTEKKAEGGEEMRSPSMEARSEGRWW